MAKSRYDELVEPKLDLIKGWARNGLTLEDIAHNLGITRQTLAGYTKTHKELKEAIEEGKEIADLRVENALYQKAIGYYSEEEKVVTVKDPDGETRPEVVKYRVYNKPDITAIIYWLKNRKPGTWRDKIEENIDTSETHDILMITQREVTNEDADSMEATS